MKKILCIILSFVLAFSAATVAFAAGNNEKEDTDFAKLLAEKGVTEDFIRSFNGQTLDIVPHSDVAAMINNGELNGVSFLGIDLGFVYGTQYSFQWSQLNVSKSNLSTLWNEMDRYLVSFLKPNYTNVDRMCTARNATAICNFIGHLLDPEYRDQTISFYAEGYANDLTRDYAMRKEFYQTISDKSGLTDAIIGNWLQVTGYNFTCGLCGKKFSLSNTQIDNQLAAQGGIVCPNTQCKKVQPITDYTREPIYAPKTGLNYRPFVVSTLGVPIYSENGPSDGPTLDNYFTVSSEEYRVPSELGGYIIKRVIEKAIDNGPIATVISMLSRLTKDYIGDVLDAMAALFNKKLTYYGYTKNDLKNYDVLFNMLAGGFASHMTYIPFPAYRFGATQDTTEQFLYLMIYTNLLGKHLNNDSVINKYKRAIDNSSEINGTKKKHVKMFIDAMFFSDLTTLSLNMREIAEDNNRNIPSNWGWTFGNFWSDLIARIVGFFDSIFRTLKKGISLDMFA